MRDARTWVLTEGPQQCGTCFTPIPPRTWYLELRLPRTPVLMRCEACAAAEGVPVPAWREWAQP